jgi:hypothetical protein
VIDLTRAVVSYLRADTILAAKLGSFRGHPSIFGTSPIPEQSTTPFIVTHSITDTTLQTKNSLVREIDQDIGIYDDEDGSAADVEVIAEYIREKLRTSFDVPDWSMSSLDVSGPILNDTDDLHGRVLMARIVLDR